MMRRFKEMIKAAMRDSNVTEKKELICKQYKDKLLFALQQLLIITL